MSDSPVCDAVSERQLWQLRDLLLAGANPNETRDRRCALTRGYGRDPSAVHMLL